MKAYNLFFKFISLICVIFLLLSFAGCFDYSYIEQTDNTTDIPAENQNIPSEEIKIHLSYFSNDSLNPFEAKSECNMNLTSLIFDSLYEIDNSFSPIPLIAQDSPAVSEKSLTIQIKSNLQFFDETPITADDVVYSFNTAKKSERYKDILSCFNKATAQGVSSVSFELKQSNPDAANNLTFPIVKSNSIPNDDDLKSVPIGSGRYQIAINKNKELYLSYNKDRLAGYTPEHANIGLVPTADEKIYRSLYSLGHTNVFINNYSSGEYEQIIGASTQINLTNFVYLVCNKDKEIFNDINIKKAINFAIDRAELCDFSFVSFAKPSFTPFHPDFSKISDREIAQDMYSSDSVKELLDSAGYHSINPKYNFRFKEKNILDLDLIVSKDNNFKLSAAKKIKEQLDKVSIQINIKQYSQSDFLDAVKNGKYDIYLGECKLTNDMNLSSFFSSSSTVSNGIDTKSETAKIYNEYKTGSASIGEFLDSFDEELPMIPLLYRCATATSNTGMAVADNAIVSDYYHNAADWKAIND